MSLYERLVLPWLTERACNTGPVNRQREKVVPLAEGTVLEIGFGTGLNLAHYRADRVSRVLGLEPSLAMHRRAAERARAVSFDVELLDAPGERIPLEDASVDTVVTTYTLCSVPDTGAALGEMRRVLAPGGKLLFCEHGRAPDPSVERWQRRVTPVWSRLGGGCRLALPVPEELARAGFRVARLETMYLPGTLRILGFNYWGVAEAA